MAITITPEEDLTAVTRDISFTQTVTASGDSEEVINSITITPEFDDDGITTNGGTISGLHTTAFDDTIYYVDKGQATNLDDDYNFDPLSPSHVAPTVVIGTGNVPENKEIVAMVTSQTSYVDRTYSVVVTYDDTSTVSATLTQRVNNSFNGFISWLTDYNNLEYDLGADGIPFSGDEYPDES